MKVLLADDHPLLLAGVREVLEKESGFEIVGEATHGSEVLPLVAQRRPDVVLLDVRMPGVDGFVCLDRIRARFPAVKVVMFSATADPAQIQSAFRRGACGYVIKTIDPRDLAAAVRQAVEGTAYHAFGLPAVDEHSARTRALLSAREHEILRAVARGLSNRAIAAELGLSEPTVKFHLSNVYRKLGVSNRTEAARWELANGGTRGPDGGELLRAG